MVDTDNIDALTNRMVHDVRNPLTILNMLHTTLSGHLAKDPDATEELAIMKEEIAKIDTLVTEFREKLRGLYA